MVCVKGITQFYLPPTRLSTKAPVSSIQNLQRVENTAARIVTVAKKGTCSTNAGIVKLASCSSTNQVQAGRTDIQNPSFINPSVSRPSHQIASNFTSSSFLQHAFTAQTYYQNSLCQPCFLWYCSYNLEFA